MSSLRQNEIMQLHSLILNNSQQQRLFHQVHIYSPDSMQRRTSDSPVVAQHVSPSAEEHDMMCETPSHTFQLQFQLIIPLAVAHCLAPLSYF